MTMHGKPFRAELHPFPRMEIPRRTVVQAIEPEAEQVLLQAGGHVQRAYGDFVYEEHWDCPWPTLLVAWPADTSVAYLAPSGQDDGNVIFLVALLPGDLAELHLTYDYRPFFPADSLEAFVTLRVAETRIFATVPLGNSGSGRAGYLDPSARLSTDRPAGKRSVSMDKQEAERLVRAIERTHVAWLRVDQMVFNETRNTYELKCSYRGPAGWLGAKAVWKTRWITSPREWIDLLTTQRDTL